MSPAELLRARTCRVCQRLVLALGWLCASLAIPVAAQVLFDETFDQDPLANGEWVTNGNAVWVPPLSQSQACEWLGLDPNDAYGDGFNDCTLYPGEGYVLLTPGQLNRQGNIFRSQSELYDDFKITAVVELRDGTRPNVADGLCIVLIGTDGPPGLGAGGGGMGATGLGAAPTGILEFDTWANPGDSGDANHVQVAFSPTGFPAMESIPITPAPYQGVKASLPPGTLPLNNLEAPPASPNRFTTEVYVADGTVACFLTNVDAGLPRTRFLTRKIEGFVPFQGYLGVTAATGGAAENHLLHSLKLEELPPGFCIDPPGSVSRAVLNRRDARFACGDYRPGDLLNLRLTLTSVRAAGASCAAPASITIREHVPANWFPSNISSGGVYHSGTSTITWTLSGAALVAGRTVTYRVSAQDMPDGTASWSGELGEGASPVDFFPVTGDVTLVEDTPFSPCGGIRCWNILGAYATTGGAAPGHAALRLDYLTDGVVFEGGFIWYPGAFIDTAFGGDGISGSAAAGLENGTRGRNPEDIPQVFPWNDPDGFIDLNSEVFGGNPDEVMAYGQAYVLNLTGGSLEVYLGVSSDDSIQVLLNGEEVWINNVARGGASDCFPQDVTEPLLLFPGENPLVVKVFDGGGDWNFSLRFQDPFGNPMTQGLEVRKAPEGACILPPIAATRGIDVTETLFVEGREVPRWTPGATYDVSITATQVRSPTPECPSPAQVEVRETVPAGWIPSNPSDGGSVNGDTITWTLTGANIRAGKVLTYRVQAGEEPGNVSFKGTVGDAFVASPHRTSGERLVYNPTAFSGQGFLTQWLLLTPYRQASLSPAAPGEDIMRLDYLTDGGAINEIDVEPTAGDTVDTDYSPGGAARSTGLEPTAAPINPGGVPTWLGWQDLDDTISFETVHGGDENGVMSYAVAYIDVEADITVDIGLSSDDAVQVLLDGEEIWIHNIARPIGAADQVQDLISSAEVFALSPLTAGRHKLMVKVFEGAGFHSFRLRFQDPATTLPVTAGISVCLDPDPVACGVLPRPLFLRGDSNSDGWVSMADVLYTLDYVFRGGAAPSCFEAADVDGNGRLEITDVIRILNFLFTGGPPPSAAYPDCETALSHACFYPVSPCGARVVRLPEPTLRLELDVKRLVEEGVTPNPVTATVQLRNTEPGDFPVRGWSLSVRSGPYPQCEIRSATVLGTLGALVSEGGLRRTSSFHRTELVSGPGDRGAVSTIVLAFTELITLPGNEIPHDLLKLGLAGTFVPGDCTPCLLEFHDGLRGSGEPVRNLLDSGTRDYQPFSRPAEVRFCSAVASLAPNGPAASLSLPASDPTKLFKLVPRPTLGSVLIMTLDGADPEDQSALYVRWGGTPSPIAFDHAADARGRASQRLVVPLARDETCFVLVQGSVVRGGDVEGTLRVTTSSLALERASSDCGEEGCSGLFHLAVRGAGFDASTSFAIELPPGQSVAALEEVVVSDERAEVVFDVTVLPEGDYDLVAVKGGGGGGVGPGGISARLPKAVKVRRKRIGARLEVSLDAPAYYREQQLRSVTLRYANTGDEEMPAPLFEVVGTAGTLLGVAEDLSLPSWQLPDFTLAGVVSSDVSPGPLQVLGIHLPGVAGRLPAGASGEVPILFRHPNPFSAPPLPGERLELSVRALDTSPAADPLTWSRLGVPQGMTTQTWAALRTMLVTRFGADYHDALSQIATRLKRRGQRPWGVRDLFDFAALVARNQPAAVIIGKARAPDKEPLASRIVGARRGLTTVACATTDAEGSFALGPLADGPYELVVEGFVVPRTVVTISGGEDEFPILLEAVSEDGSSLSCPPRAPPTGLFQPAPGLPGSSLLPVIAVAMKPAVSEDPNDKEGPDGDLPVAPGETLRYTIQFENCPNPTVEGAANRIVIIDSLPPLFDPSDIRFVEFGLGEDYQVPVGTGGGDDQSSGYSSNDNSNRFRVVTTQEVSVDYPPDIGPIFFLAHSRVSLVKTMDELAAVTLDLCGVEADPRSVDPACPIQGELAAIAGRIVLGEPHVIWVIEGREPLTFRQDPAVYADPRVGLIPPHREPPDGTGYVTYEVKVSESAMDGETIVNSASIVFDSNEADPTEPEEHTVRVRFRRGDPTDDAIIDLEDPVSLLNCLFLGREEDCPSCVDAADANDDGLFDIADPVRLLNFLFSGAPPPPDPGPDTCGFDTTPDIDPITKLPTYNLGCSFSSLRCP